MHIIFLLFVNLRCTRQNYCSKDLQFNSNEKFFKVNLKARSSLLVILIKNNMETFSIKKKTLVIKDFMP